MKWILGYGTKFVWNSVTSTLRAPSKRREAVSDDITYNSTGTQTLVCQIKKIPECKKDWRIETTFREKLLGNE
jgi:hypothetical protein